jgi:hypothetical protein
MGRTCRTRGTKEKVIQSFDGKTEGNNHQKDLDVDQGTILQ